MRNAEQDAIEGLLRQVEEQHARCRRRGPWPAQRRIVFGLASSGVRVHARTPAPVLAQFLQRRRRIKAIEPAASAMRWFLRSMVRRALFVSADSREDRLDADLLEQLQHLVDVDRRALWRAQCRLDPPGCARLRLLAWIWNLRSTSRSDVRLLGEIDRAEDPHGEGPRQVGPGRFGRAATQLYRRLQAPLPLSPTHSAGCEIGDDLLRRGRTVVSPPCSSARRPPALRARARRRATRNTWPGTWMCDFRVSRSTAFYSVRG